jgi:hypothetical protein
VARAADADTGRVRAAVPVRRAAAGPDPSVAAVVLLGLLRERLEKAAHQLVLAQALERGELLGRELGKALAVAQPLEHFVADV